MKLALALLRRALMPSPGCANSITGSQCPCATHTWTHKLPTVFMAPLLTKSSSSGQSIHLHLSLTHFIRRIFSLPLSLRTHCRASQFFSFPFFCATFLHAHFISCSYSSSICLHHSQSFCAYFCLQFYFITLNCISITNN